MLSEQDRQLLRALYEAYEAYDRVPVSSVTLTTPLGLSEAEVDDLIEELEQSGHVHNAGAPGFWFPDIDRVLRDAFEDEVELPASIPDGPRSRPSALSERACR